MLPSEMEDVWAMKKELADFTGTDPAAWIVRAEKFFEKNAIHSGDKMQWAFMSMEDEEALLWFYSWTQEHIDADWDSFSHALIRRFRGIGDGSVKQSNKMQEQQQTFHMDVTKKEGTDSHGKFGKVQQVQEQRGRTREASIHVTETSQKKRIEPNTMEESQVEHRSLKLQSLLLLVAAPSETVPTEPDILMTSTSFRLTFPASGTNPHHLS